MVNGMKTNTAPKSNRTITVDGRAYTYVRTTFNPYVAANVYTVTSERGEEYTIEPWADKSLGIYRLQGADRGMSAIGTLEMVNGKLVDATEKFRAAKITYSGVIGSLRPTYHFADGTTLG